MSLSITVDLRDQLSPVRDQGRRPTCLAFASSTAHQHAQGHGTDFSVEWLYYHAVTKAGGAHNDGATIPDAVSVITSPGQPLESDWPYLDEIVDVKAWKPPAVTKLFQCSSESIVLSEFVSRLNDGIPIVAALFVYNDFVFSKSWIRIDNEVILPDDSSPIDMSRGHAVVVVGAADINGDQHFLLRNSWGSGWAYHGHAWIHCKEFERRLIGAFTLNNGANYV